VTDAKSGEIQDTVNDSKLVRISRSCPPTSGVAQEHIVLNLDGDIANWWQKGNAIPSSGVGRTSDTFLCVYRLPFSSSQSSGFINSRSI